MTFELKKNCPERSYWCNCIFYGKLALSRHFRIRTARLAVLGIVAASLGVCNVIGVAAKERPLPLTEQNEQQIFTLIGDLPANVGLKLIASYYTVDEDGRNCMKNPRDFDRFRPRDPLKRYDIPIDAAAQLTKREIPIKHYIGVCELQLFKIEMAIHGRYGDQRGQQSTAYPIFYVHNSADRVSGNNNFDDKGHLQVDARCTWSFLIRPRGIELSKFLTCQDVGTHLKLDQLAGKSVTLAVAVDAEERTPFPNTWIKVPQGWKPCEPKDGEWETCQKPLTFKTFRMNDQTCTVYPGCTEQQSNDL